MYLHLTSSIIKSNAPIKEYRELLKPLSNINLRRSSKFNILAVYGAILCLSNKELSSNMGIYIATEYGPIMDVNHVLDTVTSESNIVMPFDFLNINSNNVSFYVSKALNANGKNMVLTSQDLSFEKAMQLAFFDLQLNEVEETLIGAVDESLEDIENYKKYTANVLNKPSKDGSFWFYGNSCPAGAIAQIKSIKEYSNINEIKKDISLSEKYISLNQFATIDDNLKEELKLGSNTLIHTEEFFGCDGAVHFMELLNHKGEALHIAKESHGKFMVIELTVI